MSRKTIIALYGFKRVCKPGAAISLPVALTLILSCSGARSVYAQDARTILQNLIGTYSGLNSYQGQSNASLRQASANGLNLSEIAFTTTLLYQRPNKLKLEFTSPKGGYTVCCDGNTLVFYQDRTQTFSTMAVTVRNLQELSAQLLKLRIVARFDTLYFLAGNKLPPAVTNIKRLPDDVRNGRPVFVVTAREKTPSAVITWTWMVDKQTNILARIVGRTTNAAGTLKFVQHSKTMTNRVPMDSILTQTIIAPKLNTNLDPSNFVFRAPPSARKVPFDAAVQQQHQRFSGSTSEPANPGK